MIRLLLGSDMIEFLDEEGDRRRQGDAATSGVFKQQIQERIGRIAS
jgi:hypothetical protein